MESCETQSFGLDDSAFHQLPSFRSKGFQLWWYDSRWCADLNGPDCEFHRIYVEDLSEKDADELLCDLEKFSAGLDISRARVRRDLILSPQYCHLLSCDNRKH